MTVRDFLNQKDIMSCGIVVIKDLKMIDYYDWSVNIKILDSKIKNISIVNYRMIALTI